MSSCISIKTLPQVAISLFVLLLQPANVMADQGGVILYGTDACSICRQYIATFKTLGIPYEYRKTTTPSINDEMTQRLREAGNNAAYVSLPVITYKGTTTERPPLASIVKDYIDSTSFPATYSIVVYGTDSRATNALRKDLDILGLRYTFKDAEQRAHNIEMFEMVEGNEVQIPVVLVNKRVLVNPNLAQFINTLLQAQ